MAEFLEEFSSLLFTVTSSPLLTDFTPPPPLSKRGLKLVCNVNILYGNLKSEMPRNLNEIVRSWIRLQVPTYGHSTTISCHHWYHWKLIAGFLCPCALIFRWSQLHYKSSNETFWAPNGTRLTTRCHFTGPKKVSISRAQLFPFARIKSITYGAL